MIDLSRLWNGNHQPVEQREQRSTLAKDSLTAIIVSALAWAGAGALERETPAFSAALRVVPVLAAAIWAIRRMSPHAGHNVVQLQPFHEEYVIPAPIYTAAPYIAPQRNNWFTGLFSNLNNYQGRGWFNNPNVFHQRQPYVDPAPIFTHNANPFIARDMQPLAPSGISNISPAFSHEFNGNPPSSFWRW
jgi:hypothetical protein